MDKNRWLGVIMQVGDLVKWSQSWLDGCSTLQMKGLYKVQVGIVIQQARQNGCWEVIWSDEDIVNVHYDYLEVLWK
jgi:hypothetical protein